MADQLRRPEAVSREVTALSFGFYTAAEARRVSVKRITATEVLDRLDNAVPDGLYDPAMGPTDPKGTCATCRLGYAHCPGHFGRVELPLPVYNPVVFPTVLRLLSACCLHCGGFRMSVKRTERYTRRLRLLAAGRLAQSAGVAVTGDDLKPPSGSRGTRKAAEDDGDELDLSDADASMEEEEEEAPEEDGNTESTGGSGSRGAASPPAWTTHTWGEARRMMTQFLAKQPGVCERCGCKSPGLVGEAPNKIFRKPLPGKAQARNAAQGVDVEGQLRELFVRLCSAGGDAASDVGAIFGGAGAAPAPFEINRADKDGVDDEDDAEEDDGDDDMSDAPSSDASDSDEPPGQLREQGGPPRVRPPVLVTPTEARALLRRLWEEDADWVALAYAASPDVANAAAAAAVSGRAQGGAHAGLVGDPECFFLQCLLVPPNKLRPPSRLGDMTFEHPQNEQYKTILVAAARLTDIMRGDALRNAQKNAADARAAVAAAAAGSEPDPDRATPAAPAAARAIAERASAYAAQLATPAGRVAASMRLWLEMQAGVNRLVGIASAGTKEAPVGIKQQLERKQGLFRMNMMGKRVNYAARSVISPDPYVAPGEVGIPPFIAQKLTFTEMVTPHNVAHLRKLVEAGPDSYPGATAVENEAGRVVLLAHLTPQKRVALAKSLLAAPAPGVGPRPGWATKAVYRHLRDGDMLLTNRQPTLHKPGLMAHRARVLKGQRTIRLHYSNCATFNADFDGDEINLHLPQEQHGVAEAAGIVAADEQFCVPTDGKPVRGLIQDHVVAGVLLLQRGSFLSAAQFQRLLGEAALGLATGTRGSGRGSSAAAHAPVALGPGLTLLPGGTSLKLPVPAIVKPMPLWTGKQLLSSVLALLAAGRAPLTTAAKTKVPEDYWPGGPSCGEDVLAVRTGDVVTGVIDKNSFAKFGLLHAVAELYGNADAGHLLAALSRMLTCYLSDHGFTCGMDDMALTPGAEEQRRQSLGGADAVSAAAAETFAFSGTPGAAAAHGRSLAEVRAVLVKRLRERKDAEAGLDSQSTGPLNKITSQTIKAALPAGQVKPFPRNCLSLMTISGAKGGPVNFAQISCLLGQQELEGRRVPRMPSGKTLPCFDPYDTAARAGGYISDRFLTGIRPQEYYFHCMAGREGLVDTAVKTSRSGYLQRCLVKNLESLRVGYDATVRDCDGSVVQFVYGEDGLDVAKTAYLKHFGFLAANAAAVSDALVAWAPLLDAAGEEPVDLSTSPDGFGPRHLPPQARFPPHNTLHAVGEAYSRDLESYVTANPDGLLAAAAGAPHASSSRRSRPVAGPPGQVSAPAFRKLMLARHMRALAPPGEAVGVLAAQSVGEPSTQMTLNTFHFAGRGEANVTLGIPRLRELLMAAAKRIGTPIMTLPVSGDIPPDRREAAAKALASRLRRVTLAELVEALTVTEVPFDATRRTFCRSYTITCTLRTEDDPQRVAAGAVSFPEAAGAFRLDFTRHLITALKAELARANSAEATQIKSARATARPQRAQGGDDDDGDDGAAAAKDDAAGAPEDGGAEKRQETGAELGEDSDVDEDGSDDEGAKAADRRAARQGEGYAAPEGEDEAAQHQQRAAKGAGDVAAAAAMDEDDVNDGDEEEEDGGEKAKPKGGAQRGGAVRGKGASSDLLTTLEVAQASCVEDGAGRRVSVTVHLKLGAPKLLVLSLAQRAAVRCEVRCTPGIRKCYVLQDEKDASAWRVQTDGINFLAANSCGDLVDVARITSNDVYAVLQQYGVEAARGTLLAEVRAVFGVYGIGVDARHLSLIVDAMTHTGGYRPCSRVGLDACPSPLLKMSFETATACVTDATLRGSTDPLCSPSARLVVGRLVDCGTAACGLQYDLKRAQQLHKERLAKAL